MMQLLVDIPTWLEGVFPDAPRGFARTPHPRTGPWTYVERDVRPMLALFVICTGWREDDGRRWLHVSCSRSSRLPDWHDLRRVKDLFIGADRKAIQVLPPAAQYVNIHPHVLHLWACLDGDGLPDFRKGGQI